MTEAWRWTDTDRKMLAAFEIQRPGIRLGAIDYGWLVERLTAAVAELQRRDVAGRALLDYAEDSELIPRKSVEALFATPPTPAPAAEAGERRPLVEYLGRLTPEQLLSPEARVEGARVLADMADARRRAADRACVTPLEQIGRAHV